MWLRAGRRIWFKVFCTYLGLPLSRPGGKDDPATKFTIFWTAAHDSPGPWQPSTLHSLASYLHHLCEQHPARFTDQSLIHEIANVVKYWANGQVSCWLPTLVAQNQEAGVLRAGTGGCFSPTVRTSLPFLPEEERSVFPEVTQVCRNQS